MPNAREALAVFGRPTDVARLCGIRHSAVSKWLKQGIIPAGRVLQLEAIAKEQRLPVDVNALRALAKQPESRRAA